jgi:TRAP-type C4-dicarboxylate transport system substrate-binding protein
MRRLMKIAVAALVVMALMLSAFGCATEAPAPTAAPAPATEPTTAPAPAAEPTTAAQPVGDVIELKMHHHEPPGSCVSTTLHNVFAKKIEDATNGRVKVTTYPAETLGKSKDAVDMAVNGIADISWSNLGMFPGRFPLTEVASLPMFGIKTAKQGSLVVQEMYETSPEIQKEWESVHMLFIYSQAPHHIGLRDKEVKTLEDLQGQRVRGLAGAQLKFIQALGITPVTMPMPEVFEAIQKGTIDGYSADFTGADGFRFNEVTKYAIDVPIYPQNFFLIMNKKKWESLQPDIQEAITSVSGMVGAEFYGSGWDECNEKQKAASIEKGMKILSISEQEQARWAELAPPIWDEWVQAADTKGADGQALLDKVRSLVEKHK